MNPIARSFSTLLLVTFCFLTATVPPTARGCGNDGSYRADYLNDGDEAMIVNMPGWRFGMMLDRLARTQGREDRETSDTEVAAGEPATPSSDRVLKLDVEYLTQAIEASAVPADRRAAMVESFRAYRAALLGSGPLPVTKPNWWEHPVRPTPSPAPVPAMPEELRSVLPEDLRLYLEGAAAFHEVRSRANGDSTARAVAAWRKLLELPAEQRRERSVWAAYMIGKALLREMTDDDTTATANASEAAYRAQREAEVARAKGQGPVIVAAFEQTRSLAADGFRDPLGLAMESLGWQAFVERKQGRDAPAIHHYYDMYLTGTAAQRCSAFLSLRQTLGGCLYYKSTAEELRPLAADPVVRDIVTLWIAADNAQCDGWLGVLREAGGTVEPAIAEQLAVVAYRRGDFDTARAYAGAAGTSSTLGQWVTAKILLYEGHVDEGGALLKRILPDANKRLAGIARAGNRFECGWPEWEGGIPEAEYALLLLGKRDYAGALTYFIQGSDNTDAAYVAERVMTIKELTEYVREREKAEDAGKPKAAGDDQYEDGPRMDSKGLRDILGRRLVRAGKFDDALQYFDKENERPCAERYAKHLKAARNENLPERERALNYFAAACDARNSGDAFMATLGPPYGSLPRPGAVVLRSGGPVAKDDMPFHPSEVRPGGAKEFSPLLRQALAPSDDERKRVAASAPSPNVPHFCEFVGAEHGWQAAKLLPNNDPTLVYVLWQSVRWINDLDDKRADKFYQALVNRCRKLPISAEADRIRWFPKQAPPVPEEVLKIAGPNPGGEAPHWR